MHETLTYIQKSILISIVMACTTVAALTSKFHTALS